ncbi:UNVERIFIED_CONTAM: Retrovirus-related Pol polyprotein from transposon opus [Sesamum latifolium]|uniref:Retrovirus-related Pol polyprotein from transposon opus n=1 Tax=Sesamum latifolium TaxID=2727402 RepID=A0AAW2UVI7_9LAMI
MLQKDCVNLSNARDPITVCIMNSDKFELQVSMEEHSEALCHLEAGKEEITSRPRRFLPLDGPTPSELKPSIEKPPLLKLKPLPSHLKYVFLGKDETLPVIVSSDFTDLQEKLKRVLRENMKAIGWSVADIKGISPITCTHKILMEEGHKSKAQPQRRLNPNMQEVVKKEILKWLAAGIIYPISDSMWVAIAPEDQEKTTFTCPYGTFAFRRMPFGLCNVPATFQHCMILVFGDFIDHFMEVFMDDFSVYASSFNACLVNLEKILQRCEEINLVFNWKKCHFMMKEGIVLGHKVSYRGIEVDKAKVDLIAKLPLPQSLKEVRGFLGHAGFYRRFIKDFSKIARPLTNLLSKDAHFQFDDVCLHAFHALKEKLTTAPIVSAPVWDLPFEIMCDASNETLGAVLGQRVAK